MSLVNGFRRRNVHRVALGYLAFEWLDKVVDQWRPDDLRPANTP
jgi:hypothetical protein